MAAKFGRLRSLRARVFMLCVAVVVVPAVLLSAVMLWESGRRLRFAAAVQHAANAVATSAHPEDAARQQASTTAARIRLWRNGVLRVDVDEDVHGFWAKFGAWLFDPQPLPTRSNNEGFDDAVGVGITALGAACRFTPERAVLWCDARVAVHDSDDIVVQVHMSAHRGILSVNDVRYQLLKLLVLLLPLALLLGAVLSHRVVRPIELLAKQVAQASLATPLKSLVLGRADEVGELSRSFVALNEALHAHAERNEQFAADVVHELKNPIATIRGACELITAEPAQPAVQLIADASVRLERTVSRLLELSRAERMQAPLVDDVDIIAVLRQVAGELRLPAHVQVTGPSAWPQQRVLVRGDEAALRAVFANVLDNAAAHARSRIDVGVSCETAQVRIVVADDGPGIDAAHAPRVFDRFYTTRRAAGGTGLGLALARAWWANHRGDIALRGHGELGGAEFTLRVPLA